MTVGDLISFDTDWNHRNPGHNLGLIIHVYSFENEFIDAEFLWSDLGKVEAGVYHSFELNIISKGKR